MKNKNTSYKIKYVFYSGNTYIHLFVNKIQSNMASDYNKEAPPLQHRGELLKDIRKERGKIRLAF